MALLQRLFVCIALSCAWTLALSDPPPRPLSSFEAAKKAARDGIYSEHHRDFYCDCAWTPNKPGTSGRIDASGCGYKFRKNKARGQVLEWEHVVPAAFFVSNACAGARGMISA
jgi:deoxyribonuclease-1